MMAQSIGSGVTGSTFPSRDEDMLGQKPPTPQRRRSCKVIWTTMKAPTITMSTTLTWTRSGMTPMC